MRIGNTTFIKGGPTGSPRAYDALTLAWRAAVWAASGSVSYDQLGYVDRLIFDLRASAALGALDRLWLHAAENVQQATIDLLALAVASPTNSPTFTANRGFKGNAATQYIDTGFNWQTAAGKYTQNDASYGVWIETRGSDGIATAYMGNENGGYGRFLKTGSAPATREVSVNSSTSPGTFTPASQTEFAHGQRLTSSSVEIYGAAGTVESNNSVVSANLGPRNFYALAVNYPAGTPTFPSDGRLSAVWIGKSMPSATVLAFRNALRTYMTSVGVP